MESIPLNVTHVYTRQHHTKGLQCPFEGPFLIESRPTRSTVRIEVGQYSDGRKRYEIRHFNDLKLAHEDSPAASRPKLGRPSKTSTTLDTPQSTERAPNPPPDKSKQTSSTGSADGTGDMKNHETSYPNSRVPASVDKSGLSMNTGPPNIPFSGRQKRSTRNPNPQYVDAIQLSSLRPWSASEDEISALNKSIYGKLV